jgi:hypothetical protein
MSFNFQIPGNFDITQNAELFVMDISNMSSRKYHWKINCGNTLNAMFDTKTYIESGSNNQEYNIVLTINNTQVESWLTTTPGLTYDNGTNTNSQGILSSTAENFNFRLLEIAALEIFGHAKARAAIGNDQDFNNYQNVVSAHLYTAFNSNQSLRNEFFEQYVQLDRTELNGNDVNGTLSFNLANSSIFVYGNLSGNVIDATPSSVTTNIFQTNYSANMRIQFSGIN